MEYNKKLFDSLEKIANKYETLSNKSQTDTSLDFNEIKKINIELKKHQSVVSLFYIYKKKIEDAIQDEQVIAGSDQELKEIAKLDLDSIKSEIPYLEKELKKQLIPVDPNDSKDVIMEMRPAAGGDESCIFVADLFDTYKRYFDQQKWKLSIMDITPEPHGYSYISFSVSGKDVYSKLKFESGVHRVQRVPATESKGRVHTSTITVAVMPKLEKIDLVINPTDLRIDVYRASGAGGQHVNRTESAVRITHLPTGVMASCQEGKSQIQNRETAMNMLKAKLWHRLEEERKKEIDSTRKNQVGTGERSEKIRTYNYPQNRITDHRIGLTLNKLDIIMQSGALNEIIDQLIANDQLKKMSELDI